jgi:hypothetical protein
MLERSPRVKAIDFHPNNSWVVFGLYSGTLALHDYSNNVLLFFIRRHAFELYKHRLFLFVQLNSFHKKTGSLQDLMISSFVYLTIIQCKG